MRQLVAIKTTQSMAGDRLRHFEKYKQVMKLREQRRILHDEFCTMASLPDHPNIVKLLGAITTIPNRYCLVMEYCEKGSLDKFLQNKAEMLLLDGELVGRSATVDAVSEGQRAKLTDTDSCWKVAIY